MPLVNRRWGLLIALTTVSLTSLVADVTWTRSGAHHHRGRRTALHAAAVVLGGAVLATVLLGYNYIQASSED